MSNISIGKFLIFVLFATAVIALITNYFNHTYIKAEFKKMDPMPTRMPVYYKGYKIGTSTKVKISKDFKTTYLYITLNQRGLHLPKNISVEIKNYNDEIKYVDIIYPSAPTIKFITNGDIINGKSTLSLNGISDINQAHLDHLAEKGELLLESATQTTDSLTGMINIFTRIIEENRANIISSTTNLNISMANLAATTTNLRDISYKINNGLTEEIIKNSSYNLEQTTLNLANSTKGVTTITDNFSVLVPKLSVLIDAVQLVVCNVNDIIVGLKKTLQKKFSGARLIFGTAVSK